MKKYTIMAIPSIDIWLIITERYIINNHKSVNENLEIIIIGCIQLMVHL
jgi:hypothetical protein